MGFRIVQVVESFEGGAGLDERRDAAGEAVGFRVSFAKLRRQHVRQLDLADLGLDLGVGHSGIDVMLKSFFAKQSDKKFLRQIGVRVILAFFDKKTRPFRSPDQRMGRNDAVKFDPDLIDVRRT